MPTEVSVTKQSLAVTNNTLLQTPQQTQTNANVFCKHLVNQKQHK